METTGIHPIGAYIRRRQESIVKRVAFYSIYEMCTEAERIMRKIWLVQW